MVAAVADEKGTSVQSRDYTRSCMSQKETPCHLTLVTAARWEDRTEETSQKTCLNAYNDAMLSGDRALTRHLVLFSESRFCCGLYSLRM